MSGRLSENGKVLLAELGERAGEVGSTISERLGLFADLLAVDDAVLDFDTLRREVAARAEADGTISFYAEGHDDLVKRARELAELSPLPAWALAVAMRVLDQAEACKERRAEIVALHASAAGLLDERSELECCSARGLRADRRDKLLKWLDTGGQNWGIISNSHIVNRSRDI